MDIASAIDIARANRQQRVWEEHNLDLSSYQEVTIREVAAVMGLSWRGEAFRRAIVNALDSGSIESGGKFGAENTIRVQTRYGPSRMVFQIWRTPAK